MGGKAQVPCVVTGWLQELDLTRGSLGQALSQLQVGTSKMACMDGTGTCLTSEVWADIEREAKDASDAFLVVEDDCRFWSKATTEVPGA